MTIVVAIMVEIMVMISLVVLGRVSLLTGGDGMEVTCWR